MCIDKRINTVRRAKSLCQEQHVDDAQFLIDIREVAVSTLRQVLVQGTHPTSLNHWINFAVLLILALSQLTNLKFVHPVQVRKFRVMTLVFFVAWLVAMFWVTLLLPGDVNVFARVLLILPGFYQLGLMIWRTFFAAQSDGPAAKRVLVGS